MTSVLLLQELHLKLVFSIINDWSAGKGDLGTDSPKSPLLVVEDYPSVKFDSGTQTLLRSETGDIQVNYGRRMLLRGGSVSALSSGAIQFDNRGESRLISFDSGDNKYYANEISTSIDITNFNVLTFRTENLGLGEIKVAAESSSVRSLTSLALIRNNIDQLLVQASSAAVFRSRSTTQFPGITVKSFDYLTIAAFDDDIIQYGRIIRYGVLNNNGILNIESHANTDSLDTFQSKGDTTFNVQNFFSTSNGNVEIASQNNQIYTIKGNLAITAKDDFIVSYTVTSTLQAAVVNLVNNYEIANPYYSQTNVQKIQFNGLASQAIYTSDNPSDHFDIHSGVPTVTFFCSSSLPI